MRLRLPKMSQVKSGGLKFVDAFMKHDLMTLAAALAFYTALALAPLLLIVLSVVGLLGEDSKNLLLEQIQGLAGPQASSAITAIIESSSKEPKSSGVAGIFGVLILLFSASGVFAQLQSSLNVIWQAVSKKETSGKFAWIRKRMLSMGMVLSLGFLAMVSLLVSAALAFFFPNDGTIWNVISALISATVFTAMFALIYKYLPDADMSWRHAWTGGVITAILFLIGKSLIGMYLGKSAIGSAYGAAGSLIVLLAWVYYSAIVVFSGAEITRLVSAKDGNADAIQGNQPKRNRATFKEAPLGGT